MILHIAPIAIYYHLLMTPLCLYLILIPKHCLKRLILKPINYLTGFAPTDCHLTPKKTKFIIIKPSKAKFDFSGLNILINGIPLEWIGVGLNEESSKFLGVILDDSLTWKHHINHINKKISKSLFAIKQVKHILNIDSLKTIYFARIQPWHIGMGKCDQFYS